MLFDNIRPALSEFGDKVLVYPIWNEHLSKITPLEKELIELRPYLRHPVFWFFKNDPLLDKHTMLTSKSFRSLIDFAATKCGSVKLFEKEDIEYFQDGDCGVYHNTAGKETIESYRKFGKTFKPLSVDFLVPKEYSKE